MIQIAEVTRVFDNGRAQIAVVRQGACAHDCSKCGGCVPTATLPTIVVEAENLAQASVGERVMVESDSSSILGLAALTYLMPMATLIGGYMLGSSMGMTQGYCVLMAGAGFGLGVGVLVAVTRFLTKKQGIRFHITEIRED